MSVVGMDFGNMSLLIAQTSKGGVDVILNDASMRQTATTMSFQGKQRFFGDAAAAMARSNVRNTISCMKLLVGRKYNDPDVQEELRRAPFQHSCRNDGGIDIVVSYQDDTRKIPVEHLMAMMLSLGKTIAFNANNGVQIGDAVLAVPCFFTDGQRRGIMDACQIVGLNCLKVVNETTAIALSYGIYKSAKGLFSETDPIHVMFVDIGYTSYSVVIAEFLKEKLVIRSTAWDRYVGGRDFDDIIVEFLAEQFQKKFNINVRNNMKAMLKLAAAAEKAKKTLSPQGVTEANVSVECLAEDRDLNTIITLEEFERRAQRLTERLPGPLLAALAEAGLTKEQISDVEIVGGSSRVQCIKRTLGQVMGLDPTVVNFGLKTTMNSDEAVARGSALQCAMLSSRVKVKPFTITDRIQYPVEAVYESTGGGMSGPMDEEEDGNNENLQTSRRGSMESVQLYARGDEIPHKPRRITFRNKCTPFDISLQYGTIAQSNGQYEFQPSLPIGHSINIATYRIDIPEKYRSTPNGEGYDVRVTFALDRSGMVVLSSAQLMKELSPEDIPPTPESGGATTTTTPTPIPSGDSKETTEQPPTVPKRRFAKIDLETIILQGQGLGSNQLKECITVEATMTAEDNLIRETADKRNELESFIYSMRHKLDSLLKNYCTNSERTNLCTNIDAAEEWLYGEGFETTKLEYGKKLDSLKGPAALIEFRYNEECSRPAACDLFKQQFATIRAFASNQELEHITDEERHVLRSETDRMESWLYDMLGRQADLGQYQDPVLTVESITQRRNELFRLTNPIMSKPKPKPAASGSTAKEDDSDKKTTSGDASESKGGEPAANKTENGNGGNNEKMDTTEQ
jgi:heat shock protein 4